MGSCKGKLWTELSEKGHSLLQFDQATDYTVSTGSSRQFLVDWVIACKEPEKKESTELSPGAHLSLLWFGII
jgi:hypothetical protein